MSSLFSHVFIPLAILFIFSEKLKLNKKNILILSFFSILPDTDAYVFIHRASVHNIFILIIPILMFVILKNKEISGVAAFYLISHIILDIFNGGVYVLYPLYDNVFFLRAELLFNDGNMMSVIYYGIRDEIVPIRIGEPVISSENVGTMILLTIISLLSVIRYMSNIKSVKGLQKV